MTKRLLIYSGTMLFFRLMFSKLCSILLSFKLHMLSIPHQNIQTGGGLPIIILGQKAILKIGKNVNLANRWEVGWGQKCCIRVRSNAILKIGDNVGINSSGIFCDNSITIGNHVHIGGGSKIYDTDFHTLNYLDRRDPILNGRSKTKAVKIEDDVFIGTSCIIGKGVTIGTRSIIAAGSVVTKSIPADELWGGNPARFIRKINQ